MKLFKKVLAFLLIPLLWGQIAQAYFYSYAIFKTGNKTFVCFGDNHESKLKKNEVNFKQKLAVLSWAKALNASIVVEDSTNKIDTYLLSLMKLSFENKSECPLYQLASWAYHERIPVVNSEFRQVWQHGQGKRAFESLLQVMQEIEGYNDTPQLNEIYQQELASFKRLLIDNEKFFNLFRNSDESVKKIIDRISYTDYKNEIDNIFKYLDYLIPASDTEKKFEAIKLFSTKILDLRLLHDSYKQNSNVVFICAGGAHISRIYQYFFNVERSYSSNNVTEQEPDAINVDEILARYFPNVKPIANSYALKLLDFKAKYPMISALLLNYITPRAAMAIVSVLFGYGCMVSVDKLCNFLKISSQYKAPVVLSAALIPTLGLLKLSLNYYDSNTKLIVQLPRAKL